MAFGEHGRQIGEVAQRESDGDAVERCIAQRESTPQAIDLRAGRASERSMP
jgi:hypothetical protein